LQTLGTCLKIFGTMTYFFVGSIFYSAVASFVDDDDLQLIQTRVLQKSLDDPKSLDEPVVFPNCSNWGLLHFNPEEDCQYTAADLLTSDGENKCLNLEHKKRAGGVVGLYHDCNGVGLRSADVPSSCKTFSSPEIAGNCCKDECGFLEAATAKSKLETECLNDLSSREWVDWDCEGIAPYSLLSQYAGFTRNAAAPAFCKYSNNCDIKGLVKRCCPDFCKPDSPSTGFPDLGFSGGAVVMKKEVIPLPDVSTIEGQARCLRTYGGFGDYPLFNLDYSCRTSTNKSAASPTYCNTTARQLKGFKYTSRSEKEESLKVRATDSLCCQTDCQIATEGTTTAVTRCGGASMGAPTTTTTTLDLTSSGGQTLCLNKYSSGWNGWDCQGTGGTNAAAPAYCDSANAEYRKAIAQVCCAPYCVSVSTTTTTTIPGEGTNPGGADCFGAIASWGPDFDCNEKSDMFCGHDSADGLDVSLCCQDHCGTKQERHSKKKEAEADRKQAEATRKSTRQESSSKRKDAESTRKKQKKEDEWLTKRSAQEGENKKSEDERKSKRGFSEGEKKNERSWKAKRGADKQAAEKREATRKGNRKEKKKKFANSEALKKKNHKDSVNKVEKKKKGRRGEKNKKWQN